MADEKRRAGFIHDLVAGDIESGKYSGRVVTRFPPEPNGYLHIGHAKSICLSFGLAEQFDGTCNLRFDDTNPTTEDPEFVNSIQQDIRWLGFDWHDPPLFASDYFERLYGYAVDLIRAGKAYVDSLSEEEIREYRGTVNEAGRDSPFRDRSVEENVDLFERMRAGEFAEGAHVLRAKIDMAAANMKMRDPLLYRIRKAHHYRTGDAWCIYPMYDFAHCLSDSIESITHSLCTLEFENNREIYDWVLANLDVPRPAPEQTEFARLSLNYTVLSKRKLLELVDDGHVTGWDDPRMPTLSGLRRRGYTPESIRSFCDTIGVAKANSVVDVAQLEHAIRDQLNRTAPRVLAVLEPLPLIVENYPEGESEELEAPYYPHDVPLEGSRSLSFSRNLYIERDDFRDDPPAKFHRMAPGREVRLRYGYIVRCTGFDRDDAGEIAAVRCTYDPATRGGGAPDGRKVRGTIHWVSAEHSLAARIHLYDRLFADPRPDRGKGGEDFKSFLNPDSHTVLEDSRVEASLATARPGERFQFERRGYFFVDPLAQDGGGPVFTRTVTLRDAWRRITAAVESPSAPPKAHPKSGQDAPKPGVETSAEAAVRRASPELQTEIDRLTEAPYELTESDAELIARDAAIRALFEAAVDEYAEAAAIAKWVVNELLREAKSGPLEITGRQLAGTVRLVEERTISAGVGKELLAEILTNGGDPEQIVAERNWGRLDDRSEIEAIVDQVLGGHPDQVDEYRGGKTALLGFFVGQVMKHTAGRADPATVRSLLESALTGEPR